MPNRPPNDRNEPIQPASSLVSGPFARGESFDKRIGSEGDSHPTVQPCPNEIIFAAKEIIIIYKYSWGLIGYIPRNVAKA